MRHSRSRVDRYIVHGAFIGPQEVRDVCRASVEIGIATAGYIQSNTLQLHCVKAGDYRICKASRAIVTA
jgi:hypothetical protein